MDIDLEISEKFKYKETLHHIKSNKKLGSFKSFIKNFKKVDDLFLRAKLSKTTKGTNLSLVQIIKYDNTKNRPLDSAIKDNMTL